MVDVINIDELKKTLAEFAEERDWQQFHHPKNLAMALTCEGAELLEIFQWLSEADSLSSHLNDTIKAKTAEEMADVLLYLIRLADLMKINLADAVRTKIEINHKKYPAEQVKGSAKKYSEY